MGKLMRVHEFIIPECKLGPAGAASLWQLGLGLSRQWSAKQRRPVSG